VHGASGRAYAKLEPMDRGPIQAKRVVAATVSVALMMGGWACSGLIASSEGDGHKHDRDADAATRSPKPPLDGGFEDSQRHPSDASAPDTRASDVAHPDVIAAPVIVATYGTPTALAADEAYVYWESGGSVLDCPVGGCPTGPSVLASTADPGAGSEALVAGASAAYFLSSPAGIEDCPATGCGLSAPAFVEAEDAGYAGGPVNSQFLVADDTNAYFTDTREIWTCPLGSSCAALTLLYDAGSGESIQNLAVSKDQLFFISFLQGYYSGCSYAGCATVRSLSLKNGGAPTDVCSLGTITVNSLLAAGGSVYFTYDFSSSHTSTKTGIYRCPATGGGVTTYALDAAPYGLAVDATNLYWTNATTSGDVVTCALGPSCTSPRTVATGQSDPRAIAVNSKSVFWATDTSILSAAK
jgi:hypothetical protein